MKGDDLEMSSPKSFSRAGSLCVGDPQALLLQAFNSNNLELFLKAISTDGCEPNHLYDKEYMTILDMAAEQDGKIKYARKVIEAGADINLRNPVRNKAPIHVAASCGNLQMLQLLVEMGADVNLQDNKSFTAFHYICEQKWKENEVHNKHRRCLQYLLQLDSLHLNLVNKRGQTPIHLAAMQGSEDAVKMILEKGSKLDLDSHRIGPHKKTAREVIIEKFPKLENELPVIEPIQNIKMDSTMLFSLLKNGEEERFCAAFKKEMEDKAQKNLLSACDGDRTFLQFCCEKGYSLAAQTLLDSGADVNHVPASSGIGAWRPIDLVCQEGKLLVLQILLEQEELDCSPNAWGDTVLHILAKKSSEKPFFDCLSTILEKDLPILKLDINAQDKKGSTALHYAVKYGGDESVLQLLKHGAYIGTFNKFGDTPLSHMDCNTLKTHLDNCLNGSGSPRDENYSFVLDYNFLVPPKKFNVVKDEVKLKLTNEDEEEVESVKQYLRETDPLLYMSKKKYLRNLLTHPLLSSFLYLKWQRIQLFYYVNLLIYFLFCFFLTIFILLGRKEIVSETVKLNSIEPTEPVKVLHEKVNATDIPKPNSGSEEELLDWSDIVRGFLIILTAILIVRELFQLIVSPKKYLISFENWLELFMLTVTVLIVVFGCNRLGNVVVCSQLFALAILSSWIVFVLLIGKHPLLCLNIEMFKTVSITFLKFLAWYSFLIIAFALSFYTLFRECKSGNDCPEDQPFLHAGGSVFKTIVMMTGEFEAGDIPFVSVVGTSHLIFILFVFMIAIVLFNLLNGLAVSDTQAIRDDALLYSYISRVKLINYIEVMVLGDPIPFRKFFNRIQRLCCCLPSVDEERQRILCLDYFSKRITFFTGLMPEGKLYVYPNRGNRIMFHDKLPQCSDNSSCVPCEFVLDETTCREIEHIISSRKTIESGESSSDFENIKIELQLCQKTLSSFKQKFEFLEQESKQNEKLLIQILSVISLKNNEEQ